MIIDDIFILIVSLLLMIKGATMATKYSARIAEGFNLSKYTVGFLIVAVISILPESFISINAALKGVPSFGLGMLFGSNIADMTLVFAIIILFANRGLKIESRILKIRKIYPFLLLMPLVLGLNGNFSRIEGLALILAGGIFYYLSLREGVDGTTIPVKNVDKGKNFLMLLFSMAILLVGAYFIVSSAVSIADFIGISPILMGMLVVGLGTTMPEMLFAIQAVKRKDDSLAVGDILGTVLADATILVGILALVSPFSFPQKIVYVTGGFMVVASFILFKFMKTEKVLSRTESYLLFAFWIIFVLVEFLINK